MLKIPRTIKNHAFNFVLTAVLLITLAATANAITYREGFEAGYFNGAELQYHHGWFQTRKDPDTQATLDMTEIVKESSPERYRLGMGDWAFAWIAHPFSWSELGVDDYIILGMDFKTNSEGTGNPFNDDRVGWNIKDDDTDSDLICGVQFDDGSSVIEGYWLNTAGTSKPKPLITDDWEEGHPKRSTWYRLNAKFTKKGDTKFEVYVAVDELNDDGSTATENVITGSLDTGTLGDNAPHSKYFTAEKIWPAFKNYDSDSDGPVDNAYFHIEDGLDDVAEVEVTTNSATEGGSTGSFRIQLLSNPPENVTVTVTCWPIINAKDIKLGNEDPGEPYDIEFTHDDYDWETVTVTAYNDDETEAPEVAEIDFSISSNDNDFDGHYVAPLPVRIKINDNDNDDQSDALVAGPYLIYTNDTAKMMVLWILDSDPTCTLEWSEQEDFVPLTDYDDNIPSNNSGSYGYQYRYPISSLSTSTKYYYRLSYSTGGKSYKYIGSFQTAPTSSATDVKFLAYGDTRGNGGDPAYGHDPVCMSINETISIDSGYQTFLLQAADWVENGNNDTDWEDNYFNRDLPNARSMLASLPVMGCTGNHEFNSSMSTLFPDYWPYDDIYWPGETKHLYYYFDYGPIRVVVADQYAYGNYGQKTNRMGYDWEEPYDFENNVQLNWIKDTLSGSSKKWNFLIFHQPLYHAGGHSLDTFHPLVDEMEELFETNGDWDITEDVDMVFCGHNHFYARCLEDDIRHIITGGGGAPLRNPEDPPGTQNNVKVSKEAFNFCEIDIRDNVLYLIARNREGSILDAFALAKDGTPETWSFIVKDSSDNAVAWFDNLGNLALNGDLDEESTHTANGSNDEFRIQDSGSNDIAIIDSTDGNMYIDGFLYQEQDMSLLSPEGFIVKNSSGDAVAFIDNSGNMYLKGALFDFPD